MIGVPAMLKDIDWRSSNYVGDYSGGGACGWAVRSGVGRVPASNHVLNTKKPKRANTKVSLMVYITRSQELVQVTEVTNSKDTDPWLASESEDAPKTPEVSGAEDMAEANPKTGDASVDDDAPETVAETVAETPESEPKSESESEPKSESDSAAEVDEADESSDESGDSGDADDSNDGFVPTVVPERPDARNVSIETYTANRGTRETVFVRPSEATYVPSEPKLYAAPGAEDDEEESFGFPEVPADTQRLFVAIEIPRKLKREFAELANSFRPREFDRVRWIDEEAMHLTLKFLGDTPNDQITDIKAALQRTAESTGKFSVNIGRTGCFPSFRDPRICWVGFTGELRRLEQLQGRVEGGMVALGLEEDDRNFRGHITVGRTRPGVRGRFAEDIGVSWQHAPLRTTGQSVPVNAIALYRSYIEDNDDTRYEHLANFELG